MSKQIIWLIFLFLGMSLQGEQRYFFPVHLPRDCGDYAGYWTLVLEPGYLEIEAENQIVNLAEAGHPYPGVGKLWVIKDKKRLEKIFNLTGLTRKSKFQLLSEAGKIITCPLVDLGYFRPNQGTIFTLAILNPPRKKEFKTTRWLLAWEEKKPEENFAPRMITFDKISLQECGDYLFRCESGFKGEVFTEQACYRFSFQEKDFYLTSFWHHPQKDFELEEYQTRACLGSKDIFQILPAGIFLSAIFQKEESLFLLGSGGDGARVCRYLLKFQNDEFRIIKESACLEY